jgi:hypothetical protein
MIPLASDLLPFPGQMRREDHLKSARLPDRLSSSGRAMIVDYFSEGLYRTYTSQKLVHFRARPLPDAYQSYSVLSSWVAKW